MTPLESGLLMGLMRAVSPLKRVLSRPEKRTRSARRLTRDQGQTNAAVLTTGFAALATLIRRNERVAELAGRVDQLAENVAKLNDNLASLSDAIVVGSAQQARGRDELLTQLAFAVNDFKIAVTGPLGARVATLEEAAGQLQAEMRARLEALTQTVGEARNWAEDASKSARQAHEGAEAQLSALQSETLPGLTAQLAGLPPLLAEIRNCIEKVHTEAPNLTQALLSEPLQHLTNTAVETRNWAEEAYKWARQAHDGTEARLNLLQNVKLIGLATQLHQAIALQMSARARTEAALRRRSPIEDARSEKYAAAKPRTFEAYIARAKRDYPKVFPLWWQRLENHRLATDQTKIGNVANEHDLYSRIFRDFVNVHAQGRILDLGCGNFGRPFYLQDLPRKLISAIEPLPMKEPADFEIVRGIGEYLPWPDASFSTVVSATSLDHCLSLERSVAEIKRVLAKNGKLLLWIDLVPGSPRYEPNAPDYEPADQFHLFHFDRAWLEPILDADFEIAERVELDMLSFYSKVFYLLRKRLRPSQSSKKKRIG
jgi:SAM-dependent methyltransferase